MNLRTAEIKTQALLDTTLSIIGQFVGNSGYWIHTHVPNFDKSSHFSVARHSRGGGWGLVVYPDGVVMQAEASDILVRSLEDPNAQQVDRIRAHSKITPGSHFFIPQNRYEEFRGELAPVFMPESNTDPIAMIVWRTGFSSLSTTRSYNPALNPTTVESLRSALLSHS